MSATVKAMCDRLAGERLAELTSARWSSSFAAYLDRLETRYPHDPEMRAYVERSRALLTQEVTGGD